MGHKFGYYEIKLSLDEIWKRTLSFWERNGGHIKDQHYASNGLYGLLEVKRDISAMSYGETYRMNFGFRQTESMTYVSVEVSLAFGYGMQWLKPQKIMKNWALEIGTTPQKLTREVDKEFFNILTDIQNIPLQQSIDPSKKYCHQCGKENKFENNYCKHCGTKLDM